MTWFSASTTSVARVSASREEVWAVLTDPALLARLTPFLSHIERVDEGRWRWEMTSIPVVGMQVVPAFTERMGFTEPSRIDFVHEPPAGAKERAAASGHYDLTEIDGGTLLAIELSVLVDLPVTRLAGPAVTMTMKGVLTTMGNRFSANLLQHLGATAI